MSEFNLDSYLASQQAEGTSHGEGSFTISHQKATQKRAQFSLVREHSWVLKLVQAAVAWNCSGLTIKQSRTTSTFHFGFSELERMPSRQTLVESILLADFEDPSPEHSFATALRVIVERSHLSFMFNLDSGLGVPDSVYAGVFYGELTEDSRRRIRESWADGLTLAVHHISHTEANRLLLNFIPIRKHGLPMIGELDHYAYTSPIPIVLDGRRVDGLFRTPALRWGFSKKPLAVAGLDFSSERMPSLKLAADAFNREFTMLSPRPLGTRIPWAEEASPAYLLLAAEIGSKFRNLSPDANSIIHWVRDGVVVQSDKLEPRTKHLHLAIFLSAEGLETDLTGFKLRLSEEFEHRKEAALESAAEYLHERLERNLDPVGTESPTESGVIEPDENEEVSFLSIIKRRMVDSKFAVASEGYESLRKNYEKELSHFSVTLSEKHRAKVEAEMERLELLEADRKREERLAAELARLKAQKVREEILEAAAAKQKAANQRARLLAAELARSNFEKIAPPPKPTDVYRHREQVQRREAIQTRYEENKAKKKREQSGPSDSEWAEQLRHKSLAREARQAAEKAGLPYPEAQESDRVDWRKYL